MDEQGHLSIGNLIADPATLTVEPSRSSVARLAAGRRLDIPPPSAPAASARRRRGRLGVGVAQTSLNSASVPAPGGEQTGKDPTNRGKLGSKRQSWSTAMVCRR